MVDVTGESSRDDNQGRALGGPQTFIAFYDASFQRIYNYVRYRVNDRETAEDLTARGAQVHVDRVPRNAHQPGTGHSRWS